MTYQKVPSGPVLSFETSAQRTAAGTWVAEGQLAYDKEQGKHYRWDGSTWDEFGESGGPGGGAPADADYLVGTANGDLSAEIVVGTTPGGELGGTWDSPTVDATHSGSTHAAATTTHEAAADPHTGYVLESLIDAKGDLYSGSANNTVVVTTVGADGTVLQADAASPGGVKWDTAPPAGGSAPDDADYLVGTANATLSGEIVVGTTPGGELGNTWASPTVDATHSGSTHAATQAAAEATAAAANTADIATHAGLADPHTGYRLESADHSHASTGLQAGNIAATAVTVDSTNLDGVATNVQTVFEELETQVQSAATTHAGAADPHTGYRLESADHSHATTGLQAGNIAAASVTIADAGSDFTATTVEGALDEIQADNEAHVAAADPHTGYRLESADHTHATTGAQAGQLDHGTALTGLTDDDHTQYRLESADHTHATTGAQAGTIDHGVLTGLTDDDHTQYLKESDVDAVIFTVGAFFETSTTLTTGVRAIWRAPFSCTVTQVRGYVDTGTTTVINAAKLGTGDFCSADITIDPSDAWEAGTVNQNQSLSAGDTVSVEIATAGTATQLAIQIELTRDLSP